LVEFRNCNPELERLGYKLASLAVDPPARAQRLRAMLELPFPILCDVERTAVQSWGLYNRWERGGIAVPATVVLSPEGRIELLQREGMTRRLRAHELVRFLARGGRLRRHAVIPRLGDWWRALRG
jgi:peroxiredoxin